MNTKHYLVISGIVGGVIGSLLTALLVSPVTAQRDNFDTIQCSRLEVVDAEGRLKVVLDGNGHSGYVATFGTTTGYCVWYSLTLKMAVLLKSTPKAQTKAWRLWG